MKCDWKLYMYNMYRVVITEIRLGLSTYDCDGVKWLVECQSHWNTDETYGFACVIAWGIHVRFRGGDICEWINLVEMQCGDSVGVMSVSGRPCGSSTLWLICKASEFLHLQDKSFYYRRNSTSIECPRKTQILPNFIFSKVQSNFQHLNFMFCAGPHSSLYYTSWKW